LHEEWANRWLLCVFGEGVGLSKVDDSDCYLASHRALRSSSARTAGTARSTDAVAPEEMFDAVQARSRAVDRKWPLVVRCDLMSFVISDKVEVFAPDCTTPDFGRYMMKLPRRQFLSYMSHLNTRDRRLPRPTNAAIARHLCYSLNRT
jgi:hypothetical protein